MLTNTGLFGKTQQAVFEAKKAQYIEDVKLSIMTVQAEMSKAGDGKETTKTRTAKVTNRSGKENSQQEEKVFINELKNKISKLEWVKKVDEAEDSGATLPKVLIVTSKEGYEILVVNIDNANKTAEVNEESFGLTSEPIIITYDANGGTGEVASQQVRKGFTAILNENAFLKNNWHFAGWCLTQDGNEKITRIDGITENTTVYATWEQNVVTVSYNANNGTGEIATENVGQGDSYQIKLNNNQITKEGYIFEGWNTETNGSGTAYADGATIPEVNKNITLYAQWKANNYTITYLSNNLISGLEDISETSNHWENGKYHIQNKIAYVTATSNNSTVTTKINAYLEKNKLYKFVCNSNGKWNSDVGAIMLMDWDGGSKVLESNSFEFYAPKTGIFQLRLDVRNSGETYEFSNMGVYEIIKKQNVEYGHILGELPTAYKLIGDNLFTGFSNVTNITNNSQIKYSINNKNVSITSLTDNAWGWINEITCNLEEGKKYRFACSTNGTWGTLCNGNDEVMAGLLKDWNGGGYQTMSTQVWDISGLKSGTYKLRLDVHMNGKTYNFYNIVLREIQNVNKWYTNEIDGKEISSATPVTDNATYYIH